jgi:hypothetical protein
MDDGSQENPHNSIGRSQPWTAFTTNQWVVLAVLGGLLFAIVATLVLLLRSGMAGPALPVYLTPDVDTNPPPYALAPDVYWPPQPEPLAPADAPGNRLWWDMRFAYRRAVLLDDVARRSPSGSAVNVLWDGETAVREGAVRADQADVRIVYWDGQWWRELARTVESSAGREGWRVSFNLVGDDDGTGRYHLYYGYADATGARVPQPVGGESRAHALTLALGPQEAVEWGPTVTWMAHSTATQTLVSPDGRLVFEHPAGGLRQDTRVRLRIVPVSEGGGFGPMPAYEFHAEPPPGRVGEGQGVSWNPPVSVSINWSGLPAGASGPTWAHFRYDWATGAWEATPIEFDAETGILHFTTDQP